MKNKGRFGYNPLIKKIRRKVLYPKPRLFHMSPAKTFFIMYVFSHLFNWSCGHLPFSWSFFYFQTLTERNTRVKAYGMSAKRTYNSPWYNLRVWLGIKSQLSIFATSVCLDQGLQISIEYARHICKMKQDTIVYHYTEAHWYSSPNSSKTTTQEPDERAYLSKREDHRKVGSNWKPRYSRQGGGENVD